MTISAEKKIIIIGLIIRIFLSVIFHGSFDVDNAHYFADLLACGKNIYLYSSYNYTPFWSFFVYLIDIVHYFSNLPFYFLIKIPSIIADLFIIHFISKLVYLLTKDNKASISASLAYATNPVSLIITSLHGQFDSIPLAFILASIYYLIISKQNKYNITASGLFIGTAISLKSWPIIFLPLILFQLRKRKEAIVKVLFLSILVPFISLFPYLLITNAAVVRNVFLYRGTRDFGISVVLFFLRNKQLFTNLVNFYFSNSVLFTLIALIISYLIYLKKKISLLKGIIITLFFFYVVSANIAAQYLLWVVPFLIVDNLKLAIFYTFTALFALFTSYLDYRSKALLIHPLLNINLFGYYLPFGLILFLWWSVNILILLFYLSNKFPKKRLMPISSNLIRKNGLRSKIPTVKPWIFYLLIITSFMGGLLSFFPKTLLCENKELDYYTNISFE